MTSSMPSSAATRSAVAWLSPESMTGADAELAQRADGLGGGLARGVGDGDDGRGRAVDGDLHARAALAGQLVGAGGQAVACDALALQQAGVADGEAAAVDGGQQAVAGHGLERVGARRPAGRASAAALTIASASGCSLSPSAAATRRRTSSSSTPSAVATATTSGSPRVSVPVLSKHDGVERRGLLERHRVLEEDAALGAEAGADHDRRRGREAERVRAGDDDDGDGEQQRLLDVAADDEVPDDERQRRRRRARRARARTRRGRRGAGRAPWSSGPPGRA